MTPEKNSGSVRSNHGDMRHFREFKIQLLSSALASDKLYRSAGGSPNSHAEINTQASFGKSHIVGPGALPDLDHFGTQFEQISAKK